MLKKVPSSLLLSFIIQFETADDSTQKIAKHIYFRSCLYKVKYCADSLTVITVCCYASCMNHELHVYQRTPLYVNFDMGHFDADKDTSSAATRNLSSLGV